VPIAMRIEEIRRGLTERLRARRPEIEQAALTRVHAIADPKESADPEYTQGLRTAIAAAIAYGIDALERSEDRATPIPTALLSQARLAARNRIPLETVLRRYFAGYTLLGDFVLEEAERAGIGSGTPLKRLLRTQAALFDRMIAAVTGEYGREQGRPKSIVERRAELVSRLLDGELVSASELGYEVEAWHLGIVTIDTEGEQAVRALASALDRRVLIVPRIDRATWVWLGGRERLHLDDLEQALSTVSGPLAVGEQAKGRHGWRTTHLQAKAVFAIALRARELTRYANKGLLAAVAADDLLPEFLTDRYIAPLRANRNGGKDALATLRAYIASERNISASAALLNASRRTVANRLTAIEKRLGRPLGSIGAELDLALRLEQLESMVADS
jgi:hypothetical protein